MTKSWKRTEVTIETEMLVIFRRGAETLRAWCERCGAFSTLQRPIMPTVAALLLLFLVGPISFAVVYRLLLSGLRFEWLVLAFGAFWIVSPLVLLAITRWAYKYVPQS